MGAKAERKYKIMEGSHAKILSTYLYVAVPEEKFAVYNGRKYEENNSLLSKWEFKRDTGKGRNHRIGTSSEQPRIKRNKGRLWRR
ncbi:hypothetical protein acsn021_14080 [Anaerocolumna cellulosilytica]|uniref:Uncharacterized protein n=1 Tax=Anaerocolumna cellulosilytica TaxID=433286 RepID=A0A6S6QXQ0_9FIRM|nr:hypothetical protein acsn021_14080 [Anaerocolumna cellulosilytica]